MRALDYPGLPATEAGVVGADGSFTTSRRSRWRTRRTSAPGGYMPTTPYAAPGAVLRVVASWFGPEQLAALDATEPNYRRLRLPADVLGAPDGAQAYVSRWGVLTPGGVPLTSRSQPEVHAVLAVDPVLADLLPCADPEATVAALRDPATAGRVRARFVAAGWVLPTNLDPAPAAPSESTSG